jgi:hypothetical protein
MIRHINLKPSESKTSPIFRVLKAIEPLRNEESLKTRDFEIKLFKEYPNSSLTKILRESGIIPSEGSKPNHLKYQLRGNIHGNGQSRQVEDIYVVNAAVSSDGILTVQGVPASIDTALITGALIEISRQLQQIVSLTKHDQGPRSTFIYGKDTVYSKDNLDRLARILLNFSGLIHRYTFVSVNEGGLRTKMSPKEVESALKQTNVFEELGTSAFSENTIIQLVSAEELIRRYQNGDDFSKMGRFTLVQASVRSSKSPMEWEKMMEAIRIQAKKWFNIDSPGEPKNMKKLLTDPLFIEDDHGPFGLGVAHINSKSIIADNSIALHYTNENQHQILVPSFVRVDRMQRN